MQYSRAPLANLGLWDYRGEIWDYGITPCLKLGLQKSAMKLGLWISNPTKLGFFTHVNWEYGITPYLKLGLRDYASFEIGITGLQDPPMGALILNQPSETVKTTCISFVTLVHFGPTQWWVWCTPYFPSGPLAFEYSAGEKCILSFGGYCIRKSPSSLRGSLMKKMEVTSVWK